MLIPVVGRWRSSETESIIVIHELEPRAGLMLFERMCLCVCSQRISTRVARSSDTGEKSERGVIHTLRFL